jgi:hypothetical protein
MSSKVRRAEAQLPRPDGPARCRALEPGFDRWLNKQLHQLYDPVLTEAVPEDMMRLLEGLDQVEGASDGADQFPQAESDRAGSE